MEFIKYKVKLERHETFEFEHEVLDSPSKVKDFLFKIELHKEPQEVLMLICLDIKSRPIGVLEVSRGTVNATFCNPRDILQKALLCNAASIFIAHNHPSGADTPSKEDVESGQRIKEACEIMGIPLLDSFVLGEYSIKSLKEENLL